MTVEEQALKDAEPLPDRHNLIGSLGALLKAELELSGGTPPEVAAIRARFATIRTRGQARAYIAEVMAKVGIAKEQRKLAAKRATPSPNTSA